TAPSWLNDDALVRDIIETVIGIDMPDDFTLPTQFNSQSIGDDGGAAALANSSLSPLQQRVLVASVLAVFAPTSQLAPWLVALGGLLIVLGAAFGTRSPKHATTFDWLIRIGAVVAGAYFVYALAAQNSFIRAVRFTDYLSPLASPITSRRCFGSVWPPCWA
ncbi:MAG: hypothetical protein MUC99_13170, partial [Anaerolineae bacterium]|nr:hypothetical protein [Anaerolineae bacterium]